jgi:CTP:molybdopterin cytidylyltransferase MocA
MRLGAIILAAGQGERMGGPKALLLLPSSAEPLALAHARRALEAGCDRVVVVAMPEVVQALAPLLPAGARAAESRAPDPAGSLAIGLASLTRGGAAPDAAMITPVDVPPAKATTIAALVSAVSAGARAATPAHEGRGGHPVVCRMDALAPLRDRPAPLRDVLRALRDAHARVEVSDPDVVLDLDTPEAWRALTGQSPRFLR